MNTLQIVKHIERFLTITPPADITCEVVTCDGNQVVVDVDTGVDGTWEGAVLVVEDGDQQYDRMVIANSIGNVIHLAHSFPRRFEPVAGDTVRLTGGPLAEAKIRQFDQTSNAKDYEDEGDDLTLVTVFIPEWDIGNFALGRDEKTRGAHSIDMEHNVQVICQTPLVMGTDLESAIAAKVNLPLLAEQVGMRLYWFSKQLNMYIHGLGSLHCSLGEVQDGEGLPVGFAAVITFSIEHAK